MESEEVMPPSTGILGRKKRKPPLYYAGYQLFPNVGEEGRGGR